MSISDELMWRYFELLSLRSPDEIAQFHVCASEGENPRDIKFKLADEIVTRYHDARAAIQAKEEFIARFRSHEIPYDLPTIHIHCPAEGVSIAHLLKEAHLVNSTSDAYRMIEQQAVKIDGEKIEDKQLMIQPGTTQVYQVGKRKFAKIKVST